MVLTRQHTTLEYSKRVGEFIGPGFLHAAMGQFMVLTRQQTPLEYSNRIGDFYRSHRSRMSSVRSKKDETD